MWIVFNNSFTFAFTGTAESFSEIYHLAWIMFAALPWKIWMFNCATLSKARQLISDAKSFNYNEYLPEVFKFSFTCLCKLILKF